MQEGTVIFFNVSKGFGFRTNGNDDIFVHTSALPDTICKSDTATFDAEQRQKGLVALNAKRNQY